MGRRIRGKEVELNIRRERRFGNVTRGVGGRRWGIINNIKYASFADR